MEILNNLWNIINSQNIELINIIMAFFIFLVEAPLTFSLISNIFNITFNKKQKLFFILTTGFIAILSKFFILSPFNIIVNYLIATIFPSILFNLVGVLIVKPYLTILNITYEQANCIPIYRLGFAFLTYSIVFICSLILKYRHITLKILDDFDKKSKIIITLNLTKNLSEILNMVCNCHLGQCHRLSLS